MSTNQKVDISQAPWQECECGGKTFHPAAMVKRLSALLSPDGKEHFIPVDIFKCDRCEKVPAFIYKDVPEFPEDLKATKPFYSEPQSEK